MTIDDLLTIVVFFCKNFQTVEVPANTTIGVILMNLGSPSSTDKNDVKIYLDEFLMDKRVIDYPYLSRLILVKGLISPFRAAKSAEAYKKVWTKDGSPLIALTRELQHALERETDFPITIAMRYGTPSIKDAYDNLLAQHPGLRQVILLPMYPHYAMSSYETAVVDAQEQYKKGKYPFSIEIIKPFYNELHYIDALCTSMRPYLEKEYDHILFSYHGLPERHIHKSDTTGHHCLQLADCCQVDSLAHKTCYRHQCFTTTKLVTEKLGIPADKHSVSFQSRLGRSEWIKPYTAELLIQMPQQGIKDLVVICPAFTTDCLETLEEMAMAGKESFLNAGGNSFTFIPCMNAQPAWVHTIALWLQQLQQGNKEMLWQ